MPKVHTITVQQHVAASEHLIGPCTAALINLEHISTVWELQNSLQVIASILPVKVSACLYASFPATSQ